MYLGPASDGVEKAGFVNRRDNRMPNPPEHCVVGPYREWIFAISGQGFDIVFTIRLEPCVWIGFWDVGRETDTTDNSGVDTPCACFNISLCN